MVDHSAAGAAGKPFDMPVETGKIREYARATYARHPDYFRMAGAATPPYFLTTCEHWETEAANVFHLLKFDYARGLHAGQSFEFFGPPPVAGALLTGQSTIERIYDKESARLGTMTFIEIATAFRDNSGRAVAKVMSTVIETAPKAAGNEKPAAPPTPSLPAPEQFAEAGPAPLKVGPVTRTDLVRYAGASGDFNPAHHDEPFAQAAGLSAPMAMGLFQASIGANWAADWLGPQNLRKASIRLLSRVFPGDVIVAQGGVVRRHDVAGVPMIDVAVTCRKDGGEAVSRSELSFVAGPLAARRD